MLAWLYSTPDGDSCSRIDALDVDIESPANGADLIDHLADLGYTFEGGYAYISAWCGLTGVHLSAWEAETVVYLSNVFAREYELSKSKTYECPVDFDYKNNEKTINSIDAAFK